VLAAAAPARAESPELELAARLRSLGSHVECAVEALRHAYLQPEDRERGFERAALCLTLAGRHADALRVMEGLGGPPATPRGRFRLCLAQAFAGPGPSPACDAGGEDRLDRLAGETTVLHALRTLRLDEAARRLGQPAPPDPLLATWRAEDLELLARARAVPRPSPWLAGALSAVVPGLGRVYIGRWEDGLMSLLLVGVPAAFSTNGFVHDGRGSVRGWILGSLAGVLYVGNVYGSAVGAGVATREAERRVLSEVEVAAARRLDP
jgi:hypothetical protein